MIQTLPELVTFDEFIDWYLEKSEHRYQLVDGEYQVKQFTEGDSIESPTFPELKLTAQQVCAKEN